MSRTHEGPAAPGPGGEAEANNQEPNGSASPCAAQRIGSSRSVDAEHPDSVRVRTEVDVSDAAIDAVLRRHFLPVPGQICIRDRSGSDWILVKFLSASQLVELIDHHLRGEPVNRTLLLCDYDGLIDWPVVIGISASHNRILPMPSFADFASRGMLADDWQPPARLDALEVTAVPAASGRGPRDAEKTVLARMKQRASTVSITPLGIGRQFRVEVSFQSRDTVFLALLRAGISDQPTRLFGQHARMGSPSPNEDFVLTDCLKVEVDGEDVRELIAQAKTRIEEAEKRDRIRQQALEQQLQREKQERERKLALERESRDPSAFFTVAIGNEPARNALEYLDEHRLKVDSQVRPNGTAGVNSNGEVQRQEKKKKKVRGRRTFLLGAHLPDCSPEASLILAALCFRIGVNPITGKRPEGDLDRIARLSLLARDAGLSLADAHRALKELLDRGDVDITKEGFSVNCSRLRTRWKEGQRFRVPGHVLNCDSFEYRDDHGKRRTLRRTSKVSLLVGWFGYSGHQTAVSNGQLAKHLGLSVATVRRLLPLLDRCGLLKKCDWVPIGKGWVLGRMVVDR